MEVIFPKFPSLVDGNSWPSYLLYVATILLEAESEPLEGKVAVAWVVRNRMDKMKLTLRQVLLGKDGLIEGDDRPYEPFSCWNDDYAGQRKARLLAPDPNRVNDCYQAASAYWKLGVDPTNGATHYLNIELTKKIRGDGKLPKWAEDALAKSPGITIGKHTFLSNVI